MSVHQPAAFSRANPAFSAPIPTSHSAFPPPPEDCLPLPDHFPEPYVDPESDSRSSRSSATLETGATLVYPASVAHNAGPARGDVTQNVVYARGGVTQNGPVRGDVIHHVAPTRSDVTTNGVFVNEAKEGLRRITDKYAAPETLLRNSATGSVNDSYRLNASSGHHPAQQLYRPDSPVQLRAPQTISISRSTPPLPSTPTLITTHADSMNRLYVDGEAGSRGSLHGVGSAFSDASSDASFPLSSLHVQGDTGDGSEMSDDISGPSPVPPWNGSDGSGPVARGAGGERGGRIQSVGGLSVTSLAEGVTEQDVQQVEMFYKSHKSDVTVCHSLANLYFGSGSASAKNTSPALVSSPASGSETWEFVSTGIPVLVLDSGSHVRSRQLSIVLAEKGTGFPLWRDVVSHLTQYVCPHANFHTLRVSADSNKLAGLSFDDSKAAADFAATFKLLTSDPDDDLLKLSKKGKKKKKKQESKKVKYKPPKKTDISQPCCFQHVTKLERPQIGGSLPPPPNGFPPSSSLSSLTDAMHDRLSLSASQPRRSQSSEIFLASSGPSDQ